MRWKFPENFGNSLKYFFRNSIENFARPNAQKVWRLLRYALTGIVGEVEDRTLAQIGIA